MGIKLEGAIPSQVCMSTSSRNNQSEQGSAEAHSLILSLANTALTPAEKLTPRAGQRMGMVQNNAPLGAVSPERLGQP